MAVLSLAEDEVEIGYQTITKENLVAEISREQDETFEENQKEFSDEETSRATVRCDSPRQNQGALGGWAGFCWSVERRLSPLRQKKKPHTHYTCSVCVYAECERALCTHN